MARLSKELSKQSAIEMYEAFTGMVGDESMVIEVDELPHSATMIGRLHAVIYDTVRDGEEERYIHKFKNENAPILAIADSGDQILVIGGNYTFTEKGIEDG